MREGVHGFDEHTAGVRVGHEEPGQDGGLPVGSEIP